MLHTNKAPNVFSIPRCTAITYVWWLL